MTRYVFITGGVVSSLGKGLASAALGALLQARGYKVRLRKLDPYLNVDPGTMSPYSAWRGLRDRRRGRDRPRPRPLRAVHRRAGDQGRQHHDRPHLSRHHHQGAARRLSRRHHPGDPARHERHQGVRPRRATRGSISSSSRSAAPSATSRGCPSSRRSASSATSLRGDSCIYVHLTLLPYIPSAGELKTKPTQHSVAELRSIGIQPDILLCRTDRRHPAGRAAQARAVLQRPRDAP